jgi:hypothetical protein
MVTISSTFLVGNAVAENKNSNNRKKAARNDLLFELSECVYAILMKKYKNLSK